MFLKLTIKLIHFALEDVYLERNRNQIWVFTVKGNEGPTDMCAWIIVEMKQNVGSTAVCDWTGVELKEN